MPRIWDDSNLECQNYLNRFEQKIRDKSRQNSRITLQTISTSLSVDVDIVLL